MIRLWRICSEDKVYEEEKQLMSGKFLSLGYELSTIQRAVTIADNIERNSLLDDKGGKRSPVSVPIFSIPYSLEFNKIRRIVERHIPILYEDDVYANILSKGVKTVSRHAHTLNNALSLSDFCSRIQSRTWLDFFRQF